MILESIFKSDLKLHAQENLGIYKDILYEVKP